MLISAILLLWGVAVMGISLSVVVALMVYGFLSDAKDQTMLRNFGADDKTINEASERLIEIERNLSRATEEN